jgi:hypothetical protein
MWDAQIAQLARRQFNRVSRRQLLECGLSLTAVEHRVSEGRLVIVEQGVFAVAPPLEHDDWGRWMGATLTSPGSVLSHMSAGTAWGIWTLPRQLECVTRPGSGGPRHHGGVLAFRSSTLVGDVTDLRGIPITSVPRTLLDLARMVSGKALARTVREAVRLELITLPTLGDSLGRYRGRRGAGRLARTLARYAGLHRLNALAAALRSERSTSFARPVPFLN